MEGQDQTTVPPSHQQLVVTTHTKTNLGTEATHLYEENLLSTATPPQQ